MTKSIVFIDTEIDPQSNKILDIGAVKENEAYFHSNSKNDFVKFLQGSQFICGHNILNHDLKYIQDYLNAAAIDSNCIIDTLFLSPLLFPKKPYHKLLKDDKLQTEELNNPVNDSVKARDLFFDEISEFNKIDPWLRQIFYLLLSDKREFRAFFRFIDYTPQATYVEAIIRERCKFIVCENADIGRIIREFPIELAYCLSLINCHDKYSIIPPWVLKSFSEVDRIMDLLRNRPCLTGCSYCNDALNIHKGLKRYFNFNSFRTYVGEPLQEKAVQAALDNKSLLAVFPTGGGKSITFQLPALIAGENTKGLTVIISPLQSLMKDQVDNLEKIGIIEAVTINGLLDPIERAKSLERVADGSASMLYISPESMRSRTIEHLLLNRKIARFVIDEAHCFSAWGQDFRVDYMYIGDFIKLLQEAKNLSEKIPVSCFTATAKQKVIEDICRYFKEKLNIDLEIFTSKSSRTNLRYRIYEKGNEDEKYNTVRDIIEEKDSPAIIYVSRTRRANELAKKLSDDGFNARAFHGKMEVKKKTENQNAFITGEVQIMVATSAFGMGVDKKDIGIVIHYDISDSLENYIQEAGRAGRDENIDADCYVLFNEEDLNKHFILLNQTKLNFHEIKQIWQAIKLITKLRANMTNSALEIARAAGWDDNIQEIETRVITAIAALEASGYIKRGQNMPRIFANSILTKTAQEAIDKIAKSSKFVNEKQKENAVRIIRKLFSSKSRLRAHDDEAESRVDYIADHLGIVKDEVINIINILREEKILADTKDLTAFIKTGENCNRSLIIVEKYSRIENFLCLVFEDIEKTYNLKELCENAETSGCEGITPHNLKTILNFWAIKNWIKKQNQDYSKNHMIVVACQQGDKLKAILEKRHRLSRFIIEYLFSKTKSPGQISPAPKDEILLEFSVHELKDAFENQMQLFKTTASIAEIEETLFYLSRIEAIKIEGGFLVVYNKLSIEKLEKNPKILYKAEDYQRLNVFYENKIQQIHIVGEFAKKMIDDYKGALKFVDDYFQLNYTSFLNKYFPGSRQNEIKRNLTPSKYRQLFESLSEVQRKIIDDKESKYILVAAGPGSGKTKVLVHKLASLLLMEDVKHEQLLMVTFSRAAATEFKKRLIDLIGNAAHFVEIKTFHSYCFDLLGMVGSIDKSNEIIKTTLPKIIKDEVEISRITKTVLVVDEAQDMDQDESDLINILIEKNENIRVIEVGDDDQNIYSFRGSDSRFMLDFLKEKKAVKYELLTNYRSRPNLVSFSNQFVKKIHKRLKENEIVPNHTEHGNIKIVYYQSQNLILPVVQDIISAELAGTTCVMTTKNEEAIEVAGLLKSRRLNVKLIQSNDEFNLSNLNELRYFLNELKLPEGIFIIDDDLWKEAKRKLINRFKNSSQLELCLSIIIDFEATNTKKKYKSDLEAFIKESRIEDFFNVNGEIIYVSTIHKAKGKEFDNVFILLENFNASKDESKRQLYVGITRAKKNLYIHTNVDYFDNISVEGLQKEYNQTIYNPSSLITMHLNHRDLNLGYFKYIQHYLVNTMSGQELLVKPEGCTNSAGRFILKFSKKFMEEIHERERNGFKITRASVNYVVNWFDQERKKEYKIVIPELQFERKTLI